jgi:transaldolase
MLDQTNTPSQIGKNFVIKLPMTYDGIIAAETLEDAGIKVNLTLCFSVGQALHTLSIETIIIDASPRPIAYF